MRTEYIIPLSFQENMQKVVKGLFQETVRCLCSLHNHSADGILVFNGDLFVSRDDPLMS